MCERKMRLRSVETTSLASKQSSCHVVSFPVPSKYEYYFTCRYWVRPNVSDTFRNNKTAGPAIAYRNHLMLSPAISLNAMFHIREIAISTGPDQPLGSFALVLLTKKMSIQESSKGMVPPRIVVPRMKLSLEH
jgi:hypothetical protein